VGEGGRQANGASVTEDLPLDSPVLVMRNQKIECESTELLGRKKDAMCARSGLIPLGSFNARWIFRKLISERLERRGYSIRKVSELTRLADQFGSDKGTRLSAHMYTRVYEKFFAAFRHQAICLLEIGLLRSDIDARRVVCATEGESNASASSAPSLEMWSVYFSNAKLFGFDIDDFSRVSIDRCTIIRGDMSSRSDLANLVRVIGRPIDILIDDASHASAHQQIALGALFPHMRRGGLYVIEDLHWQHDSLEKEGVPKTRDLLRHLQTQGTFASPCLTSEEQNYIRQHTGQVWLFDSLTHEVDDNSDAIALLVKK
jgi:hypothetical protein